jgi:hypothetical protein
MTASLPAALPHRAAPTRIHGESPSVRDVQRLAASAVISAKLIEWGTPVDSDGKAVAEAYY